MEKSILSEREIRRFQHQIDMPGIGREGQELIKKARVLVVGSGGKGTSALKALMSAGVGFLGISDDTLVKEETLSRQSLYNDTDIGKQKAIVSKQYLQARNRLTEIKVHNIRLTPENLSKVVELYDILIDATNNFTSHNAIYDAAKISGKSMIFGHIENNKIFVTKLRSDNGKELKEIMENTGDPEGSDKDIDTPVAIVNSMAGTFLANEALKVILGKPSNLSDQMLIVKLSDYSFSFKPH